MEVTLSKEAWHYKLQEYCFLSYKGDVYNDFEETANIPQNLCPYFWRTVLCIFLLPVAWLGEIGRRYVFEEEGLPDRTSGYPYRNNVYGYRKGRVSNGMELTLITFMTLLFAASILFIIGFVLSIVYELSGGFFGIILLFAVLGFVAWLLYSGRDSAVYSVLSDGFSLTSSYTKAAFKKVCPAINWQEDMVQE
jgi:hypothetical protein